jgi:hypothetical protein
VKGKALVMLFSDLLGDPQEVIRSVYRLRHGGHEVILFHILDEAEVHFPFKGRYEFEDPESGKKEQVNAEDHRANYLANLNEFRELYRKECGLANADYVPMDTSVGFDKALLEYLITRTRRFG